MQIIYGYSNCTNIKYEALFRGKSLKVLTADQKYHSLLISGLAKNGASVTCFSGLPINRSVTKKIWISESDEEENGVLYHYYKTLNLPVVRQLMIFGAAFHNVLRFKSNIPDKFIICDYLNVANSYGMVLAAKVRRIPVILIVTDLPEFEGGGKLLRKLNAQLFKMADGFILLSKHMDVRINKRKVPSIILEGHVDSEHTPVKSEIRTEFETGVKEIVYAGSIKKLYGIHNLVEGFIKAKIQDTRLIIYGDGDYRQELESIAKEYTNIHYMGVRPNKEVVECENKAALLVNPRPIGPEYTRYSFPSKNMEYMVSGTPLLTTKLPGMPVEYYPYVYLLEDETPDGVAGKLKAIFSYLPERRYALGESAREFVLANKSNVIQAKKVIDFLKML